jgi:hypothetical protein
MRPSVPLLSVSLLLVAAACGGLLTIDGRACPCGDGYTCCANVCVPNGSCGGDGAGDGGALPDAPQVDDGGLSVVPTPGRTRCGATTCDPATQYCCYTDSGAFDTCNAPFCPIRRECDDPSDCNPGEVCCYHVVMSPPPIMGSSCERPERCAFPGSYFLGCSSDRDCPPESTADGGRSQPACVAQSCGGAVLQTCGLIPRNQCH